jgi:chemotaxis family two-component system sensor histidine kinase/response regulator PixL
MSRSVLIVEDSEGTREALALLLQAAGYTTAEAEDGRSALTYLHSHPAPRLILLDLMMPGMDGWEFLRERRKEPELARVPVVLFTASGGLDASAVWALGANDVIHKPASPDDLLATAGRYC